MKYNELRYEYKFNKGNYESETISIAVGLDNENPSDILKDLKAFVHSGGIAPVTTTQAPVVEEKQLTLAPQESTIEEVAPTKVEEPKTKEKSNGSKKESSKESSDKKVSSKEASPKKEKVGKNTPYDRGNDLHKKLLISLLKDTLGAKWNSQADKAKEASIALTGEAFLDQDGKILESFKKKFMEKF